MDVSRSRTQPVYMLRLTILTAKGVVHIRRTQQILLCLATFHFAVVYAFWGAVLQTFVLWNGPYDQRGPQGKLLEKEALQGAYFRSCA